MEQEEKAKPRVNYSEFRKQLPEKREGTVGWLIERYIREKELPGRRKMGISQRYTLKRLQKDAIAHKMAASLKAADFIEHCAARIAGGVKPCTARQDMTFLIVVLRYAEETWEIEGVSLAPWKKAKKQLEREQLIGKAEARTRLPSEDEKAKLRAYFAERNKNSRTKVDMLLVMEAELITGRRISEIVRIERQHVNVEKRTCMIYNLKNSKGKGYHAEFALIEGAWELFERRLREIPEGPTERLFPFNRQSCVSAYVEAKKELGIQGLRMHDNRAAAFVRLLKLGYSETQVQKGVSLHKGDGKVLRDVYLRIAAQDLHDGPAARRTQGEPRVG